MHRPSATENPQAPLSHHYLDATHITPGVVSIGVERAGFTFEAGAFHGQEPDEDRLDLDTGALDSYGARLSWADGPWSLQISGADLEDARAQCHPTTPTRLTASVSYFKGDANRSIAWMAAFGQNREVFGNLEAYLFEGTRRVSAGTPSTRAPNRWRKTFSTPAFTRSASPHTHRPSLVSALDARLYPRRRARERGARSASAATSPGISCPTTSGIVRIAVSFPRLPSVSRQRGDTCIHHPH